MISIAFLKVAQRWLVRGVGIGVIALAVVGCRATSTGYIFSGLANIKSKAEVEDFVQRAFVRNEYTGFFTAREGTLGTDELYVSWDEYRSLIVDTDSFLKYGLGLVLARYPKLTYDEFRSRQSMSAFPLEELISSQEFDYYRIWGQTYLEQIKSRPGNAYLVEREALFRARAGREPHELLTGNAYVALLRDDAKFERFLTDNAFATEFLNRFRISEDAIDPKKLGPVYTGVPPGTGS